MQLTDIEARYNDIVGILRYHEDETRAHELSDDSERSKSGIANAGPCRSIIHATEYRPARSHREQPTMSVSVHSATSDSVIEPDIAERVPPNGIQATAARSWHNAK